MKTPVMTPHELMRETGLSPRRLRILEHKVGIRQPAARRDAYTLSECLRLLQASKPSKPTRRS